MTKDADDRQGHGHAYRPGHGHDHAEDEDEDRERAARALIEANVRLSRSDATGAFRADVDAKVGRRRRCDEPTIARPSWRPNEMITSMMGAFGHASTMRKPSRLRWPVGVTAMVFAALGLQTTQGHIAEAKPIDPLPPKCDKNFNTIEIGAVHVAGGEYVGQTTFVSAKVSSCPFNPIVTWSFSSKPNGSNATVTSSSASSANVHLDVVGAYTVRMTAVIHVPSKTKPVTLSENLDIPMYATMAGDPRGLIVEAFNQHRDHLIQYYELASTTWLTANNVVAPSNPPLLAHAIVSADIGQISMEVQRARPTRVAMGVPHLDGTAINGAIWFELEKNSRGSFIPRHEEGLNTSTPFPAWGGDTHINNVKDWTHGYLWAPVYLIGSSPRTPHWSPIIVETDTGNTIWGKGIDVLLHDSVWESPGTGMNLIYQNRPTNNADDIRATHAWAPLTVRGTATLVDLSDEDWGDAHTMGFIEADPNNFKNWDCERGGAFDHCATAGTAGGCISVTRNWPRQPNWPGFDWDMRILADNETGFARAAAHDSVDMEVENFTIPFAYLPNGTNVPRDWVQATGRLVEDAGHDDFHTELHPPELIVSSKNTTPHSVMAHITTSGAWHGEPLSFFINPPPRPTPTARLRITQHKDGNANNTGFDAKVNASFTLVGLPSNDAPHHLLGTIVGTGGNGIFTRSNGAVCQTNSRALRVVVEASWEEEGAHAVRRSPVPMVAPTIPARPYVSASLTANGQAVRGAHLFYRRDKDGPAALWTEADVDANGHVDLSNLVAEAYDFRPAGSGYDFAGVPRRVDLEAGTNQLSFAATPKPATNPVVKPPPGVLGTQGEGIHVIGGTVASVGDALATSAVSAYAVNALVVDVGSLPHHLGVAKNDLRLPTEETVVVHLASIVDAKGAPISTLAASYNKPVAGPNGSQSYPTGTFLNGVAGPGVAGAHAHVRLLLGNTYVGYRMAADLPDVIFDATGTAAFALAAGTHVEDMVLTVEVTSNPKNSWFLPLLRFGEGTVYPAATGDDTTAQSPYSLALLSSLAGLPQLTPFLEERKNRAASELQMLQGIGKLPPVSLTAKATPSKGTQIAPFVLTPELKKVLEARTPLVHVP